MVPCGAGIDRDADQTRSPPTLPARSRPAPAASARAPSRNPC